MKPQNFNINIVLVIILIYECNDIKSEPLASEINEARFQRSTTSENVCKTLCNCTNENLPHVGCDLSNKSSFTLDEKYYIPSHAISLEIYLGEKTDLLIKPVFFRGNLLNRILIRGNYGGRERVEVSERAFCENNGSFPEIEIFNCHTVLFHSNSFCKESILNVTSSKEVVMLPKSFPIPTCRIFLNNIDDLRIHEHAFEGSQTTMIEISKCYMDTINELKASFKAFKIVDSKIGRISKNAFNVNTIDALIFENCEIDVAEREAITEKIICKYFSMENCDVKRVESNFILNSNLVNFNFTGNRIEKFEKDAIKFTGLTTNIVNNKIIITEQDWFAQNDMWKEIQIFNNTFGTFNYIQLGKPDNVKTCRFERNFITEPQPNSLDFKMNDCKVKDVSFHNHCTCDTSWLINLGYQNNEELFRESYCRINDTLNFCFNATIFSVQKYLEEVCNEKSKTIDCFKNQKAKKIVGEFVTPEEIASSEKNQLITYIVAIAVCAGIALILITIVIKKYCLGPKRDVSHIPHDTSTVSSQRSANKTLKTFSKEDRSIIHQTLEKIREKQAPEMYDEIYMHTKKLLNGNFTETEKVLTIGEIVRYLGECENSGEDFVAFTDILYKHLAPTTTTVNESDYAEPTTLIHAPQDGETNLTAISDRATDHIYAELNCAQQPLLVNEYSAPADLSDALYSEPIQVTNKDNNRTLITPYAIGNPTLQPSTSKNLPDVLHSNNQRPTLTTFQHINRSPRSNREIPEYTLPTKSIAHKQSDNNVKPDNTEANSDSENSGGSDITMKIDDIVEYADA